METKLKNMKDLPPWLQELWNINSSLARTAENYLQKKEDELKNIKECVYKYLSWLGVENPIEDFIRDLDNPDMLVPYKKWKRNKENGN